MIEWSWRIEDDRHILCGSWSEDADWERIFASLIGQTIRDISAFGRLPELSIALSEGCHITSFMTAEGQPAWAIFDNAPEFGQGFIHVEDGQIVEGSKRNM
jgi:hypothetical protein